MTQTKKLLWQYYLSDLYDLPRFESDNYWLACYNVINKKPKGTLSWQRCLTIQYNHKAYCISHDKVRDTVIQSKSEMKVI